MNVRLIISTAISTVVFATHARSHEMPGALMRMENSHMIVHFERCIILDEKKIADIKNKCEEIKKLQVHGQQNQDAQSRVAQKRRIDESLAINLYVTQLLVDDIEEYKMIISMLEALVKSGKTRQSSLTEQEQIRIHDHLDKMCVNTYVNIENCEDKIALFERDLTQYEAENDIGDSKLNIFYNERICEALLQWKQLMIELRGINNQIAHIVMYGTAAPNTGSQLSKLSTIEKVLVVGVGVLCIVVLLVVVGVAVRLYKA